LVRNPIRSVFILGTATAGASSSPLIRHLLTGTGAALRRGLGRDTRHCPGAISGAAAAASGAASSATQMWPRPPPRWPSCGAAARASLWHQLRRRRSDVSGKEEPALFPQLTLGGRLVVPRQERS
jgi:hypothetical protein